MLISLLRRVAIVGTRPPEKRRDSEEWQIYEAIIVEVSLLFAQLRDMGPFILVSGGAKGVDSVGARLARGSEGMGLIVHEPDYVRYEARQAPLKRNPLIVSDADEMHAFPSPWSRGTHHAIGLMLKAKKPCVVYENWRAV